MWYVWLTRCFQVREDIIIDYRPKPVSYTTAKFYKHTGGRSLRVDPNPSGVVAYYMLCLSVSVGVGYTAKYYTTVLYGTNDLINLNTAVT